MTHATVEIRDMRPADGAHLRAIQRAVMDHPSPQLLTAAIDGLGISLVAVSDRPVGYVFALVGEGTAYVPEIAVDPTRQRQGIGTALLDGLLERTKAPGVDEIRLTVHADDERAREFYRTNGFSVATRLPNYYETGSGVAIVLSRPL